MVIQHQSITLILFHSINKRWQITLIKIKFSFVETIFYQLTPNFPNKVHINSEDKMKRHSLSFKILSKGSTRTQKKLRMLVNLYGSFKNIQKMSINSLMPISLLSQIQYSTRTRQIRNNFNFWLQYKKFVRTVVKNYAHVLENKYTIPKMSKMKTIWIKQTKKSGDLVFVPFL